MHILPRLYNDEKWIFLHSADTWCLNKLLVVLLVCWYDSAWIPRAHTTFLSTLLSCLYLEAHAKSSTQAPTAPNADTHAHAPYLLANIDEWRLNKLLVWLLVCWYDCWYVGIIDLFITRDSSRLLKSRKVRLNIFDVLKSAFLIVAHYSTECSCSAWLGLPYSPEARYSLLLVERHLVRRLQLAAREEGYAQEMKVRPQN